MYRAPHIAPLILSALLIVGLSLACVACSDDSGSSSADTSNSGDTSADSSATDTSPDIASDSAQPDTTADSTADTAADGATDTTSADTLTADTQADTPQDTTQDTTASDVVGAAPICIITAPAADSEQPFDLEWTLTAGATDAEDGDLSGASVVWTSDLVTAPLGDGVSVNTLLAPGGTHVITCTATDSDGNTGSDTVSVVVLSPYVEIWHPGDGETRDSNLEVPFSGRGWDLEDGALTGSSLVWTTTVAGVTTTLPFSGETGNATLPAGTNTLTLTGTDSESNAHALSITLEMTP